MCENLPDSRRYLDETVEQYLARNKLRRCQDKDGFVCRYWCSECAAALRARLIGDVWAEKAVSDRDFFVTLTYDDKQLDRLAGDRQPAHDIDAAVRHFAPYLQRMRDMMRRLHPELLTQISYFRVAEYGDQFGRVHFHVILSFRLEWADEERRARMPRPIWDDRLIPHLRLGERYIHEWETEAEEATRKRIAERNEKRRLNRKPPLKVSTELFPSRVPWPWGYSYWENCGGGDGDYTAGYCTLGIELSAAALKAAREGRVLTDEASEELRKGWQTTRSRRRSLRYGHRFYAEQGRLTAAQGLPPNTYFKVPMGAKPIPNDLYGLAAGSDQRRYLKVSCRSDGGLWVSDFLIDRKSCDFMLTGSAARAYLDAYDAEFEVRYPNRPVPVASCVRVRKVGGRERAYHGYGVAECREQKAKQEAAQADARHLARRRRMMTKDPTIKHLTVREELAARPRGHAKPPVRVPDRCDRHRTLPGVEWFSLVESWSGAVRRQFKGQACEDRLAVLEWMKAHPALASVPPSRIYEIWRSVIALRVPNWMPWRKGEGRNGYNILATARAPRRML